jgi:hypothetical protein
MKEDVQVALVAIITLVGIFSAGFCIGSLMEQSRWENGGVKTQYYQHGLAMRQWRDNQPTYKDGGY